MRNRLVGLAALLIGATVAAAAIATIGRDARPSPTGASTQSVAGDGAAEPATPPRRVVSINLCTDQLAMMLATPGQLVSISHIATDARSSALAEEAGGYHRNDGRAESVFALRPDLVLAGTYTTRATVGMLRRLGVRVVELAPAASMADIRARVTAVGTALGREQAAANMIARFDRDLAAIDAASRADSRPRAALHYAGHYTSGSGTLADAILREAGLANVATELGYTGLTRLPLEALVMARPDLLVQAGRYTPPSLAEQALDHPAVRAIDAGDRAAVRVNHDWVCGTPAVANAVAALARAAHPARSSQATGATPVRTHSRP